MLIKYHIFLTLWTIIIAQDSKSDFLNVKMQNLNKIQHYGINEFCQTLNKPVSPIF